MLAQLDHYLGMLGKSLGRGHLDAVYDIRQILIDDEIRKIRSEINAISPNSLLLRSFKVYSQCDEDGIIEQIFDIIGTNNKTFVEIGCGDGLENNTHYLLLKGWRGLWIDSDSKNIEYIKKNVDYTENEILDLNCKLINTENVNKTIDDGLNRLIRHDYDPIIDFFSIDVDGMDLDILRSITVIKPRVICVEYNAKFPPPIAISIAPDESFLWDKTDYQGASLQSFVDLLEPKGYQLIACSISGVNAFFVKRQYSDLFHQSDVQTIFQPPRYYLIKKVVGHNPSLVYLKDTLAASSRSPGCD